MTGYEPQPPSAEIDHNQLSFNHCPLIFLPMQQWSDIFHFGFYKKGLRENVHSHWRRNIIFADLRYKWTMI